MLAKVAQFENLLELIQRFWVELLRREELESLWRLSRGSWVQKTQLVAVAVALMSLEEF